MRTGENILFHEIIGLRAEIVDSTNKNLVGMAGRIIDETKSMFLIDTKHGTKSIPKDCNSWRFHINNDSITIDGRELTKRPYERTRRN